MKNLNIILDPGHGGIDQNGNYTTAPSKMYKHDNGEIAYEGVLNRNIAKEILKCFQVENNKNLRVFFTVEPIDSRDLSLRERVNLANKFNPNNTLYISIHCNAGKGSGFEIFTSKGETKSDKLATEIVNAVEPTYIKYGLPIRKDFSDGDPDKEAGFYVLKKTFCPAVLLEYGFFDNIKDFELLKNPKFINKIAFDTFHGIMKYVENYEN